MNRRSFAKLLPAAAALLAVACHASHAAPPPAAAASPLTTAQMAQYQKAAPRRAHSEAHLRAYPLTNADQPDFIFVAAPEAKA